MTIIDKMEELKHRYPDRTALIDMKTGEEITFAEFDRKSDAVCGYFSENGFEKGDRIVVFIPIGIDFYVILMAIFKMGMQAVFIDPYAGIKHIDRCCGMISPDSIIGSGEVLFWGNFLSGIRRIGRKINYKKIFKEILNEKNGQDIKKNTEKSGSGNIKKAKAERETPALISFTSGSTGFPKIIMRTHGFLMGQHNVLEKNIKFNENTKVFSSFPIFLLSHMATGTTTAIPDMNFKSPARTKAASIIAQIEERNVENILLPPSVLENVAEYSRKNNIRLKCVQKIFTGGAPVFPKLMKNLKEVFPDSKVRALYGASEAEPISVLNFEDVTELDIQEMKDGAGLLVGKKVNEIDLKIAKIESGRGKTEAEGTVKGEILVKGENVLKSYLNMENEPDKEWHDTGDMGYINENGKLVLLGRVKGRIMLRNKVYYPFSIETAFSFCEIVKKSAIVSKNEKLYIIIEKKEGFKEKVSENAEIKRLCEKFEIDRAVEGKVPVDKRHNSKTDYKKLEKIIERL